MQKKVTEKAARRWVLPIVLALLLIVFVVLPLSFTFFNGIQLGNVALIPISGTITGDGDSYFGQSTVSSSVMVEFIQEADRNPQIKVILLEINSPGGSAVASDEIASAVQGAEKPVVALIREVGASGGYWIASAADIIIANRMSITGSIGVLSSYLEFSGLMEKYGIGYERLVAGEYKDVGTPFRSLQAKEKELLQRKLERIHGFFIEEIAKNRNLDDAVVRDIATGEFFLGVEALELGLVDALGDRQTAEQYIQQTYGLEQVDYVTYEERRGLLDIFARALSASFFSVGEGIGSMLVRQDSYLLWT